MAKSDFVSTYLKWGGEILKKYVRHTISSTRVRAPSGPLKELLKYYLEAILYNCV